MKGRYSLLNQHEDIAGGNVRFDGTGIIAACVTERIDAGESVASVIRDYSGQFTRDAVRQAQHLIATSKRLRRTQQFVFHRDKHKPIGARR